MIKDRPGSDSVDGGENVGTDKEGNPYGIPLPYVKMLQAGFQRAPGIAEIL
jgi:hypothetical protein